MLAGCIISKYYKWHVMGYIRFWGWSEETIHDKRWRYKKINDKNAMQCEKNRNQRGVWGQDHAEE